VNNPGKKPIQEILPGAFLYPIDDDLRFDSAFILIRSIDSEGSVQWAYRSTRAINSEELLGALSVQVEILTRKLASEWDEEFED
jgi:hypothetical protein